MAWIAAVLQVFGSGIDTSVDLQSDSLRADSVRMLLMSPLQMDQYGVYQQESGLLLERILPQRLSISSFSANPTKGRFKRFQEAESQNEMTFRAQGGRRLKKLWVWGSFSYRRAVLDSVRWGHRKEVDGSSPYFYGSQRAVHYLHTDYAFSTHTSLRLFGNFKVAVHTDYEMGDHYSTNDPRAVLKHFKLKLHPALQYAGAGYGVEIKGIWGYGQQESQVDYRNKEYYESSQFPEYLNWLSHGYGTMRPATSFSDRVYTNNQEYRGLGLAGYANLGKIHLSAYAALEDKQEEYDRGNSSGRYDGYDMYGDYDLREWRGRLDLTDRFGRWGVRIGFHIQDGRDLNADLFGNNYVYAANILRSALYYSLTIWGRPSFITLNNDWSYHSQVDGNMMIRRERGRYLGIMGIDHILRKRGDLQLHLAAGYSKPYANRFERSPRTANQFIEDVILHDVAWDNLSYIRAEVGLRWFFDAVGMKWLLAGASEMNHATGSLPSGIGVRRGDHHLGLSLYF